MLLASAVTFKVKRPSNETSSRPSSTLQLMETSPLMYHMTSSPSYLSFHDIFVKNTKMDAMGWETSGSPASFTNVLKRRSD